MMLSSLVRVFVVDVVDDGGQVVAGRSGDNDLAGASLDVGFRFRLRGVEAGALEDDVDAELTPGALGSVFDRVDDDLLAVDNDVVVFAFTLVVFDGVLAGLERGAVAALSGVVLQKVREHLGGGQVVDRNDFVTFSAEHLTERQTANAAKTIDCNFYCHDNKPPMIYLLILYTISRKSTRGFWKKWLKDSGEFFVKSHPQGKKAGKWGFAGLWGGPGGGNFPFPPPPSGPERAGYNPGDKRRAGKNEQTVSKKRGHLNNL